MSNDKTAICPEYDGKLRDIRILFIVAIRYNIAIACELWRNDNFTRINKDQREAYLIGIPMEFHSKIKALIGELSHRYGETNIFYQKTESVYIDCRQSISVNGRNIRIKHSRKYPKRDKYYNYLLNQLSYLNTSRLTSRWTY